MMSLKCLRVAGLTSMVVLSSLFMLPSQAQTVAMDFTGGNLGQSNGNITWGWAFTISSSVTVTDLGVYDEANNGLINSHQVGLWDSGGTLLASTTMASGLSGTAVISTSGFGSLRFNTISSLGIGAGSYVVGALYKDADADLLRFAATTVTMPPPFTFNQGRSAPGGFVFPSLTSANNGFFGPNLRFTTGTVPEPGVVVSLLGAGTLSSLLLVRRRHTRR